MKIANSITQCVTNSTPVSQNVACKSLSSKTVQPVEKQVIAQKGNFVSRLKKHFDNKRINKELARYEKKLLAAAKGESMLDAFQDLTLRSNLKKYINYQDDLKSLFFIRNKDGYCIAQAIESDIMLNLYKNSDLIDKGILRKMLLQPICPEKLYYYGCVSSIGRSNDVDLRPVVEHYIEKEMLGLAKEGGEFYDPVRVAKEVFTEEEYNKYKENAKPRADKEIAEREFKKFEESKIAILKMFVSNNSFTKEQLDSLYQECFTSSEVYRLSPYVALDYVSGNDSFVRKLLLEKDENGLCEIQRILKTYPRIVFYLFENHKLSSCIWREILSVKPVDSKAENMLVYTLVYGVMQDISLNDIKKRVTHHRVDCPQWLENVYGKINDKRKVLMNDIELPITEANKQKLKEDLELYANEVCNSDGISYYFNQVK